MAVPICCSVRGRLAVLCCLAVGLAGCSEEAWSTRQSLRADPDEFRVTPDEQKKAQIIEILEDFVPHAERFWRASDLAEPRTGRYAAAGPGVTQPRGAGQIAFVYATLLTAAPDRASFGGVPRETMIDHTIQSIRHEALTNSLSGAGYNRWGNGSWQAALETYPWAFAAHVLWDELDADTQALVERVVTREANILLTKPLASNEEGDTGAEDNAWNAPLPALAAVMFPSHPNASAWVQTAMRLAYNAHSTAADASDTTIYDGRPLKEWMGSVNLHPDLTLENHGFFNPIYQQVAHVNIGDAAIFFARAGRPIPDAFSFRTEEIWDQVLSRLATDDGDFAMPAGQDWTSKDYQHLCYLSILATRFGREEAAVLEGRALETVRRRQLTHGTGSLLGQPEIGYETMLAKRLAGAWWNHHLFGPSSSPSFDEYYAARENARGVAEYAYSDFVAGQLDKAFVSMSWDPTRPMGLVIPRGDANLSDPIFAYYAPGNLTGGASGTIGAHSTTFDDGGFSTAGTIGARRFSMTAFRDGTTILLDQGEGPTFTYSLESIPGVTGPRPVWSSAGAGLGNLPGQWLNAADRLGMIVRGGAGMRAAESGGTLQLTGSVDTGSGRRAALLLPLSDHEETEALDAFATQLDVPHGWSAFTGRAPDGSLRLAMARWAGHPSASITLSDPRGAPIPVQSSLIESGTTSLLARLGAPASQGQTMRFFVQADTPVIAQQDGDRAALVYNDEARTARVTLTYAAPDGTEQRTRRHIRTGEEVRARLVDGELTLAGPELEPLLGAQAALEDWLRDAQANTKGAARLTLLLTVPLVRAVLHLVEDALAEATSESPDPHQAAWKVELAREQLASLARSALVSGDLEDAVEAAHEALAEAEERAYGVVTTVAPLGRVQPGEPLTVRVFVANHGFETAWSGNVTLEVPAGWTVARPTKNAFVWLAPGDRKLVEWTVTPPPTVVPGENVEVRARTNYQVPCRPWRWLWFLGNPELRESVAVRRATIDPLFTISTAGVLPLAAGGYNEALVEITSWVDRPLEITVTPTAPIGAVASSARTVTVPASGTANVAIGLRGSLVTTGSGTLHLAVTSSAGVQDEATVELRFSDDLALNTVGARFPAITASSSQPSYPPSLAVDGSTASFWVSSGVNPGEGPTPERPEWLMVDFGAPVAIGTVQVVPRVDHGPRALRIELSDDGMSWVTAVDAPSVPNSTYTASLGARTSRYLRVSMTDSHDWAVPPRNNNVQVAALIVRPPAPADLAENKTGAPFPAPFASSAQSGYPAGNAFDGNESTFWVSGGTAAGEGPSVDRPEYLAVDFGAPTAIGAVRVVPRPGYGPRSYAVEVSDDGSTWTEVASEPSVPNGTLTTIFAPVTARMVRLRITGSWDWVQPPRNVQIVSMMVFAP